MKAQDTSELFFENIRVPANNMLGAEGKGFALMMTKLSQERLAQAIRSEQLPKRSSIGPLNIRRNAACSGKS